MDPEHLALCACVPHGADQTRATKTLFIIRARAARPFVLTACTERSNAPVSRRSRGSAVLNTRCCTWSGRSPEAPPVVTHSEQPTTIWCSERAAAVCGGSGPEERAVIFPTSPRATRQYGGCRPSRRRTEPLPSNLEVLARAVALRCTQTRVTQTDMRTVDTDAAHYFESAASRGTAVATDGTRKTHRMGSVPWRTSSSSRTRREQAGCAEESRSRRPDVSSTVWRAQVQTLPDSHASRRH